MHSKIYRIESEELMFEKLVLTTEAVDSISKTLVACGGGSITGVSEFHRFATAPAIGPGWLLTAFCKATLFSVWAKCTQGHGWPLGNFPAEPG